MADFLPLHIVARDGAWAVLSRPGDVLVSTHAALKGGALDAVLGTPGFVVRSPRFADAEWRWIDMTATEDAPAADGSQVTERGIQSMAARLNSGDPIMIDGGSPDSGAHSSLWASDTRANGWAHVAVEVRDESGRLHLWGRVEVLPTIAADMDANRLALGSIGFVTDGGDNDRAALVQHALTNIPAVQGLTPAGSPRAASAPVHYRSARRGSTGEKMEQTTATDGAAKRDLLAIICEMLGCAPDTSEEDAVKMLADKLKPAESAAPAEDEAAKAAAEEAARASLLAADLGTQVAALRAQIDAMAPIVAKHEARERDEKIEGACRARGITAASRIAAARAHAVKFGEPAALALIAEMATPPTATIVQPSQRTAEVPESIAASGDVDLDAKIDAAADLLMDEVRKSHPSEPKHVLFGRARKLAIKRNPAFSAA